MKSSTNIKSSGLVGASVGIPPRNIKFSHDYYNSHRYPIADNAFASSFIAVLSGSFPPGERFFVESVRHFRDKITDSELKAQVSGFIGQEALHGREHDRLNAIFSEKGIRVDFVDKGVKMGLFLLERFSPEQQLACTIFMEHFTAIFAESFLQDSKFREACEPESLKLWTWHALEELEHKSVAYDVYTQVSNSWRLKLQAGPLVAAALVPIIGGSLVAILAHDNQLQKRHIKSHLKGAAMLFGKRGLLKHVPRRLPDFFKRNFHPTQDDTRSLEQQWRKNLFGSQGLLSDIYASPTLQ